MSTSADIETPLTLEALNDNTTVTFSKYSGVQYSINGGTKYNVPSSGEIPTLNSGDKVSFYGNNTSYSSSSSAVISCSDKCYVYGNIMSLINSTNYASATTLTGLSPFSHFFSSNTNIVNHNQKDLVLPATTLTNNCYEFMFNGCTGLTSAPALPATSLANSCYSRMFQNSGITSAPALPATSLASSCYYGMFWGCKSLTIAPLLPATTLANNCYEYMFAGCTSLSSAPTLPATTLANYCYAYMFQGCTGITSAPELLASTLVSNCYNQMFNNCTNLNYVKCLATVLSNDEAKCTYKWLDGVASSGTFIKASDADWSTVTYGIPSGWTVQNN